MTPNEQIAQLTREKEHYIAEWSHACNENQCLRNDLEKLRAYHFEQNERFVEENRALREAMKEMLKITLALENPTPFQLRGWSHPWPQVADALWPETPNV